MSLLGCGGAADTKSTDAANPGVPTITAPVQAGVYYASLSGQDFWGVITPGNRWYGLHYATLNPDVYSGDLTGTGTVQASIAASGMRYQNTADTVLSGAASFTSSGSGKLAGVLSLITSPSIPPVNFNATTPSGYVFAQGAQLGALAGAWTGQLSYGSGESANFSMTIAADSGTLTATRSFASCVWNAASSIAVPQSDANLYTLTLHMAHATNCDTDLDGQTLTGIAFVTPASNNTQSLIWVATTPAGHAIAFKAVR